MYGKESLQTLIREQCLVNGLLGEDQVQVNGVELTIERIEKFMGAGCIGYSNKDRVLPATSVLEWSNEWMHLPRGAYKVVFNETVKIPLDMMAIARPRSSLLRMGVSVETAVWDAGYEGRSEAMLVVYNECGLRIKKNARLIQLVFMPLDQIQREGYKGRYQGENIDETRTRGSHPAQGEQSAYKGKKSHPIKE